MVLWQLEGAEHEPDGAQPQVLQRRKVPATHTTRTMDTQSDREQSLQCCDNYHCPLRTHRSMTARHLGSPPAASSGHWLGPWRGNLWASSLSALTSRPM